MTRKDIAQDMDRPRFYSQFWIDVAMGDRDVTSEHHGSDISDSVSDLDLGPDVEAADFDHFDDVEEVEEEPIVRAPVKAKPAKPERKSEPSRPTITSLADLANIDLLMRNSAEMDSDDVPDIETGPATDFAPFGQDAPAASSVGGDVDFEGDGAEPSLAADEDESSEDFDFDEDEEEDEWGNTRKPGKAAPKKPRRPDRPERDRRTF